MRTAFANAQLHLSGVRALNALGQVTSVEAEQRYRDQLLPELFERLVSGVRQVENIELVEAAVSVGLARVEEDPFSYLAALATAVEVLSSEAQFARIRCFSKSFREIASRVERERPFLAVSLRAFADTIGGRRDVASSILASALGFEEDGTEWPKVPRGWPMVGDVALANALRVWLRTNDLERIFAVRTLCEEIADGLLFGLASLFATYAERDTQSELSAKVLDAAPVFDDASLRRYLQRRNIRTLFPSQLEAIDSGLLGSGSWLVAMPTSSGKTLLAELKIAAELATNPGGRAVYLSPYRLLGRQVATELDRGLRLLGFRVQDVGDKFDLVLDQLAQEKGLPDVSVMTYERLDALLRLADSDRRGNELASELINSLVVVVIDEVQLVGRPSRGPRLELFLTRLRRRLPNVTILGLAAATHGVSDLASWLGASYFEAQNARPTGLIELEWRTNGSIFQRSQGGSHRIGHLDRSTSAINDAAKLVLEVPQERFPILFVETTRPSAESIVRKVAHLSVRQGDLWRDSLTSHLRTSLDSLADMVDATMGELHDLGDLIRQGLVYHHAGVPTRLLAAIENLIRQGAFRAVGATTTVAEGADLPFQLVVIPHLNFSSRGGGSGLTRELYNNIVGRAGRANVAVEGIALVVGSNARTLVNHVQGVLWRTESRAITGQLKTALIPTESLQNYRVHREARSQVLAWLGDEGTYFEEQAHELASSTLTFLTASAVERRSLESNIEALFADFESKGLAEAASPYRLTALGRRARLAGISPASCLRMSSELERLSAEGFPDAMTGITLISSELASLLASIAFEAEEVIEWSIWFKKLNTDDPSGVQTLVGLASGEGTWPYDESLYLDDLRMLSGWIMGLSYTDLGDIPPVFGGRGAFGSSDVASRASDAAEHLNRVAPLAAWAWGAAIAMIGDKGKDVPNWIRGAIELGINTEAGVELMQQYGVSRACAVVLSAALAPDWDTAQFQLADLSTQDLRNFGVTAVDRQLLLPADEERP